MPTYEYECPRGHYFHRFDSIANWRDRRPCEHKKCAEEAEQVLRPSGLRDSVLEPIVVFRAKNGQVRIPGSNTAKTPRGYERVELTTLPAIEKFERDYSRSLRNDSERRHSEHDAAFQQYMKERRSELRQAMQRMNPFERDLAELAMRKTDSRARPKGDDFQAGFQVLHYDRSNREDHRDSASNWRARQV
jgi:hypothetical protein